MWGGKTSEYRLASRAASSAGAASMVASVLAYVVQPVWVGVALAGIAGFTVTGVCIGYFVSRAQVKKAEATAAPMRMAVKPISRSV